MLQTVECAACGGSFRSLNPERSLPLCRICAADRVADTLAEGTTAIHVNLATYDPRGEEDHSAPLAKAIVRFEANEAIRVILGDERQGPDIHVERRVAGWHVSLHPDTGDPVGTIEIRDNGECRFQPEFCGSQEALLSYRGVTILS